MINLPIMAKSLPIDGAFGLKLGEKLDVAELEKLGTERDGGIIYGFKPSNPYRTLTNYSVFVTPVSNRVYHISASGKFGSMKDCREELMRLESALAKKYTKISGEISSRFGDIPKITFGTSTRKIEALCKGAFNRRELVLRYIDKTLSKEASKEETALSNRNENPQSSSQYYDEAGL